MRHDCLPDAAAARYRDATVSARASIAAALLACLAGCAAEPPRGYYRPAGMEPGEAIGAYVEQGLDALVEVRCQGVYSNLVDGRRTASVHVQLDVARTRSGDLTLPRATLTVDAEAADGGPHRSLDLSEAWSEHTSVPGDLLVPAWTRRPFDLFFDDDTLLDAGPPHALLLNWELHVGDRSLPGQCEFVLVPDDEPGSPATLEPADEAFGVRNGYYLPGVQLGERRLRSSGESRMHHLFHEPEGWLW